MRYSKVELDEVAEEAFAPRPRARWLRAVNRILHLAYRQELYRQILIRAEALKPDVVMMYKGFPIEASFVCQLQKMGCHVVNVYPDFSPHAHGAVHKKAIGAYDLVISTKSFHPELWRSVYGYNNSCVFVPQGYDPAIHLVRDLPTAPRFDVVLVATWRPEYGGLMKALGKLLAGRGISVGIGGNGWMAHREDFPSDWVFAGELQGRAYIEWLRGGRICLAPVTREVVINGTRQPGDEDTTRTYELAAAHCFFIHHRTGYARILYDESAEVPMFDTPEELAEEILYFLPRIDERNRIALAAHRRAVPAYSLDRRAEEVVSAIEVFLEHNSGNK
ncbi:MAG: glycosyltransferase [bacterium]|uniref:Glycosyltransferase n=1 Tax=Candidatus Methylomirabilis tolerans TaxID=3123416 RepID=A0AAJ1EJ60_9BACT|nr:glycosyltransferase [Candidatus Methylomirabilis sp.]